jgi:hypothetical protein
MTIPTTQNATHPDELSPTERMLEAAEILATAVLRQKKDRQESHLGLDLCPPQSVHGQHNKAENSLTNTPPQEV